MIPAPIDPRAHPPRLALAALLHGGPKAPAAASRVLEIGTGKGENLLPLAFYDPEGAYLGLGDDPDDIESARAAAAEIGLSNIRFELADWLEPPLESGPFDHVLCRGVLGRVTGSSQREILRLCRAALAEHGLLYLDYPVLPGASHRQLVRALISPAAPAAAPPARRVEQARAAAAAFRAMIAPSQHPYPHLLAIELTRAADSPDPVLWRDYLHAPERAFFHRDIVAAAAAHGLRFVADAAFNQPEGYVPPDIREDLESHGQRGADLDQALDVLRCRSSRGSLFCREEAPGAPPPDPALLDELCIAAALAPKSPDVRLDPGAEEVFERAPDERIASADPLLKALLLALHDAWPRPLRFADAVGLAVERLHRAGADGEPSDAQLAGVAGDLWELYRRGLCDFFPGSFRFEGGHAGGNDDPPRSGASPSALVLHPLARYEARTGALLTTPAHTSLPVSGFDAAMLPHMQPGADEDALVGAMLIEASRGAVAIEVGGARLTDPALLEPMVRALVRRSGAMLGRWGLTSSP